MARARALVLDEERGELLRAALLISRACGGSRALLVAGHQPDVETLGRILASVSEFADDVRAHLTRRKR
jgi:hypothetical protein